MAANDKPWRDRGVTPVGEAVYPYLNRPDSKFGDPTYKVNLRFTGEEGKALFDKLTAQAEEALAHQKTIDASYKKIKKLKIPMALEQDEEGDDIPDTYILKLKTRAFFTTAEGDSEPNNLPIVDSNKEPTDVIIRSGSKLKVSYNLGPYTVQGGGLSARINAVQVLELAEGGGGVSDFDKEDGFTAEPKTSKEGPVDEEEEW